MNDELRHFGIKGRSGRYPLGSGRRPFQRLERAIGSLNRKKQKKLLKETKKVRVKDLSDEQLTKITARINLENSYYEARAKLKKNTAKESMTKKIVKKIAEEGATIIAKNLADSYSKYLGKKFWDFAEDNTKKETETKTEKETETKTEKETKKKKQKRVTRSSPTWPNSHSNNRLLLPKGSSSR